MSRLPLALFMFVAFFGSGDADGAQLTLSWVDNSNGNATTRIERRLAADTAFVAIADVPPGVTTYADGSVRPGTAYCYRLRAYEAAGVSAYSGDVCATSGYEGYEQITVTKAGTGAGTIASTPAGISCGTACSATYLAGTSVTLTAKPASGSMFKGWSGGGCIGTAPCTVAGSGSIAVTATFSLVSYTLTVAKSGPGTVASTPSGITCGSICSKACPSGTLVTLTATPNRGATFAGWSGGGCSGTGPTCVVSMKTATWVLASFKYGRGK